MSFGTILYSFFLMPIQLVFEIIFNYAYMMTGEKPGFAIIALSIAINLLVLPLYKRADAMQEEERRIEEKLRPVTTHIKKTFRGDERTMILQTYYRQNNYSPLYVLRGAVSLFLEIPFFIAAYRFLSNLSLLQGVSFGPISDLGLPDALISINGMHFNVLPVLMTAINAVSTVIFTKGYPLKKKIQLYGMAAFFLVFLYNSPSGLVFYWTLNNLFSLVKTVFYKIKDQKKAVRILSLCLGICLIAFGVYDFCRKSSPLRPVLFLAVGFALCVPFLLKALRSKVNLPSYEIKALPDKKAFWIGAAFLTVLTGLLIPSAVINASPQEFIIIGSDLHPIWYIVSSLLIASGSFVLWMGVFYHLFAPKTKVIMERIVWAACAVSIVNYLLFGNDLGTLSAELVYDGEVSYTAKQIWLNALVIVAAAAVILLISKLKPAITKGILLTSVAAMIGMSGINAVGIVDSVTQVNMSSLSFSYNQPRILSLSKTEKNVVVLMLDRAMGEYIPYIMYEHPELKEKFSGFTYYSNVISFGGHTNFGVPALFGGYDYTPVEINKRDTEPLSAKHNEALKVMPVLFGENGYNVVICDPPYAGYKEIPDLSIYDEYPDFKTYITQGNVTASYKRNQIISNRFRNFFCYSVMKISPTGFQPTLYDNGKYHQMNYLSLFVSSFDKAYDVLKNLSSITSVTADGKGSFIMMDNDTTHYTEIFSDKSYTEPDDSFKNKFNESIVLDGITLELKSRQQMGAYQVNTAALMRLGEWFDYLREQGVYDNTRIILVSDHGFGTQQIEEFLLDDTVKSINVDDRLGDAEFYYPLLMVKDFDSKEFVTSDEFMTNADVPTLAVDGLIKNAKNPFTGSAIDSSPKNDRVQYVIASEKYSIYTNNGNQFRPSRWYSVHDSIWDKKNWTLVSENSVLP